ncbi:hypothetical protein CUMW_265330 [Citrus unshiu]|uniref:Uncharacterized protein n=1 Tax=Citrus unshiu TaxID=55188 RepID=A0A2H5QVC9_CITUN|nr:hypothetical protein CUMW_265330 [Citrus unshiu]
MTTTSITMEWAMRITPNLRFNRNKIGAKQTVAKADQLTESGHRLALPYLQAVVKEGTFSCTRPVPYINPPDENIAETTLTLLSLKDSCASDESMDMKEKFGLTIQKAKPLRAVPIAISPIP